MTEALTVLCHHASPGPCPSLIGFPIPKFSGKSPADVFPVLPPFSLYYFPGHLLADVLFPLLESVSVWLSSVTIGASIDNRIVISREGALNFWNPSVSPSAFDDQQKGALLGAIRWKYPLAASASGTAGGSRPEEASVVSNQGHEHLLIFGV